MASAPPDAPPPRMGVFLPRCGVHASRGGLGPAPLHATGLLRVGLLRQHLPRPRGGATGLLCRHQRTQLHQLGCGAARGVQLPRVCRHLPSQCRRRLRQVLQSVSSSALPPFNFLPLPFFIDLFSPCSSAVRTLSPRGRRGSTNTKPGSRPPAPQCVVVVSCERIPMSSATRATPPPTACPVAHPTPPVSPRARSSIDLSAPSSNKTPRPSVLLGTKKTTTPNLDFI